MTAQDQPDLSPPVLAAGGILCRHGPAGVEVALVHRPKYDDWGLPKGKLHHGETLEEAAIREVMEETACVARPLRFAGTTEYPFRGRRKVVSFWIMEVTHQRPFEAGDEIDQVAWLAPEHALERMDHEQERILVRKVLISGNDR